MAGTILSWLWLFILLNADLVSSSSFAIINAKLEIAEKMADHDLLDAAIIPFEIFPDQVRDGLDRFSLVVSQKCDLPFSVSIELALLHPRLSRPLSATLENLPVSAWQNLLAKYHRVFAVNYHWIPLIPTPILDEKSVLLLSDLHFNTPGLSRLIQSLNSMALASLLTTRPTLGQLATKEQLAGIKDALQQWQNDPRHVYGIIDIFSAEDVMPFIRLLLNAKKITGESIGSLVMIALSCEMAILRGLSHSYEKYRAYCNQRNAMNLSELDCSLNRFLECFVIVKHVKSYLFQILKMIKDGSLLSDVRGLKPETLADTLNIFVSTSIDPNVRRFPTATSLRLVTQTGCIFALPESPSPSLPFVFVCAILYQSQKMVGRLWSFQYGLSDILDAWCSLSSYMPGSWSKSAPAIRFVRILLNNFDHDDLGANGLRERVTAQIQNIFDRIHSEVKANDVVSIVHNFLPSIKFLDHVDEITMDISRILDDIFTMHRFDSMEEAQKLMHNLNLIQSHIRMLQLYLAKAEFKQLSEQDKLAALLETITNAAAMASSVSPIPIAGIALLENEKIGYDDSPENAPQHVNNLPEAEIDDSPIMQLNNSEQADSIGETNGYAVTASNQGPDMQDDSRGLNNGTEDTENASNPKASRKKPKQKKNLKPTNVVVPEFVIVNCKCILLIFHSVAKDLARYPNLSYEYYHLNSIPSELFDKFRAREAFTIYQMHSVGESDFACFDFDPYHPITDNFSPRKSNRVDLANVEALMTLSDFRTIATNELSPDELEAFKLIRFELMPTFWATAKIEMAKLFLPLDSIAETPSSYARYVAKTNQALCEGLTGLYVKSLLHRSVTDPCLSCVPLMQRLTQDGVTQTTLPLVLVYIIYCQNVLAYNIKTVQDSLDSELAQREDFKNIINAHCQATKSTQQQLYLLALALEKISNARKFTDPTKTYMPLLRSMLSIVLSRSCATAYLCRGALYRDSANKPVIAHRILNSATESLQRHFPLAFAVRTAMCGYDYASQRMISETSAEFSSYSDCIQSLASQLGCDPFDDGLMWVYHQDHVEWVYSSLWTPLATLAIPDSKLRAEWSLYLLGMLTDTLGTASEPERRFIRSRLAELPIDISKSEAFPLVLANFRNIPLADSVDEHAEITDNFRFLQSVSEMESPSIHNLLNIVQEQFCTPLVYPVKNFPSYSTICIHIENFIETFTCWHKLALLPKNLDLTALTKQLFGNRRTLRNLICCLGEEIDGNTLSWIENKTALIKALVLDPSLLTCKQQASLFTFEAGRIFLSKYPAIMYGLFNYDKLSLEMLDEAGLHNFDLSRVKNGLPTIPTKTLLHLFRNGDFEAPWMIFWKYHTFLSFYISSNMCISDWMHMSTFWGHIPDPPSSLEYYYNQLLQPDKQLSMKTIIKHQLVQDVQFLTIAHLQNCGVSSRNLILIRAIQHCLDTEVEHRPCIVNRCNSLADKNEAHNILTMTLSTARGAPLDRSIAKRYLSDEPKWMARYLLVNLFVRRDGAFYYNPDITDADRDFLMANLFAVDRVTFFPDTK